MYLRDLEEDKLRLKEPYVSYDDMLMQQLLDVFEWRANAGAKSFTEDFKILLSANCAHKPSTECTTNSNIPNWSNYYEQMKSKYAGSINNIGLVPTIEVPANNQSNIDSQTIVPNLPSITK